MITGTDDRMELFGENTGLSRYAATDYVLKEQHVRKHKIITVKSHQSASKYHELSS